MTIRIVNLLAHLGLVVIVGLVAPGRATAQTSDAAPHRGARIGVLVGGGFVLNREIGDPNVQGLGFGADGGYTFETNFYVGADVRWFRGADRGGVQAHTLQMSLDLGFDVFFGRDIVLRPGIGIGFNRYKEIEGTDTRADSGFMLAPGLGVMVDATSSIYLRLDVRLPISFQGTSSSDLAQNEKGVDISIQPFGSVGIRF